MARKRQYTSDADRQKAFRDRRKEELRLLREGAGTTGRREPVSVRLVKVLGMLGSDHAGERAAAALQASRILKEAGLTWHDVLGVKPE